MTVRLSKPGLRVALGMTVAAFVGVVGTTVIFAADQQPPAGAAKPTAGAAEQKASERYKNVKNLQDLTVSQFQDTMVFMEAALGMNCESCHVRSPEGEMKFDLDDKPNKQAARRMIALMQGLNTEYFNNRPEVTCATCHQGRRSPMSLTPLAQPFTADQLAMQAAMPAPGAAPGGARAGGPGGPGGAPGAPAAGPGGAPGAGAAPGAGGRPPAPKETVDDVLQKYVDAIGGTAAVGKMTSAVMRGTATNRAGQASPVVVSEKVGDKYRSVLEGKPGMTRVVNGPAAWTQSGERTRDLNGVQALALRAYPSLGIASQLKTKYQRLGVGRYERLEGRDVIALNGAPTPETAETLYFDRTSGLLVRRLARLQTTMGRLQVQIDYADYRAVDGVKLPFEVKITDWDSVTTERFTEIQLNAAVDDKSFSK
jgi:photosynthetic reaction center cytochrome c subunit